MLKDFRFAARTLWGARGWTTVVVCTLAFGIGANIALFSAINGLWLRTIPVAEPGRLVRLRSVGTNDMVTSASDYGVVSPQTGLRTRATFSYPMFQELRRANQTMVDMCAGAPIGSINVVADGRAEVATGFVASGNYHQLLGVHVILGRSLTPDDDVAGAPPVAVVSDAFWSRRFGRDPNLLGRVIRANNLQVTIVGVTAPEYTGIQRVTGSAPDVTFPLVLDQLLVAADTSHLDVSAPPRIGQATYWWLQIVGRLKPSVTPDQVEGNLQGVFQQAARQGMDAHLAGLPAFARATVENRNRTAVPRLSVSDGSRGVYDVPAAQVRAVSILSGVVALILLLTCANVANLLLARVGRRQQELSVRLSLGATRARLIRQLMAENLLLALAGAGLGTLIAFYGKQLLPGQMGQAPLDWRVLVFALGLAVLTGLLFGVAPAFRGTGTLNAVLKEHGRTLTSPRSFFAKSLLVVQIVISVVLLVGAGLLLRTVDNLRRVDVGFKPDNLVLFRVDPELNHYDPAHVSALYERISERLRALPAIRSVTFSNPPMLSGNVSGTNFVVQGRPFSRGPQNDINSVRVAAGFFETLEIPLAAGRTFTARDNRTTPKVAIINESAVRKFFPGEDPMGRRFGSNPEASDQIEIVGVVRDVRYDSLRDPAPATMYVPYDQSASHATMTFQLRTAVDPLATVDSIRAAVREIDPNLPVMNVSTQVEQIEGRFAQERALASAYSLFGGLALLVAAIGLFGLMSYNVAHRTLEIGVRMALGACREDVIRLVMRESMTLVGAGVIAGAALSMAASRLVSNVLFDVAPTDLISIAGAIMSMVCVSGLAGFLPARRASRLDPMVALRSE